MPRDSANDNPALWLLGGVALGVVAMYLLDPDRGNRRRALVRDKLVSAAVITRKAIESEARDLANRAQGWSAEISKTLH